MTEFRWILLGLGLLVIAGIWWWGARGGSQAHEQADLRPASPPDPPGADDPAGTDLDDDAPTLEGARDFGVPPFEPLSIRADYSPRPAETPPVRSEPGASAHRPVNVDTRIAAEETVQADPPVAVEPPLLPIPPLPADPPMTADASEVTLDDELATATAPGPLASGPLQSAGAAVMGERRFLPRRPAESARVRTDESGRFSQVSEPARNTSELQKIVAVRVCAADDTRWPGRRLMTVLELQGLAFGRYQVYHRKHVDGRTLFCVASLVEPGTFDVAKMPDEEYRGVTLFAVLPGPTEPLQTLDALIRTARSMAESLAGTVQDADGVPLSAQRAAALRDEVARFQALL